MDYLDLKKAKMAYQKGENVTEFLRSEFNVQSNTSEIIEIAYDLQAGSYIESCIENIESATNYAQVLSSLLEPHIFKECSILDVGAGELTTLSLIANQLDQRVSEIHAFDISWSRLWHGLEFWQNTVTRKDLDLLPFVADMKQIPLASKSIDLVTSNHALEPNGANLETLLSEIFRVCKKTCVLFEPSYESNSAAGKERMDSLGYIKGMEEKIKLLGGKLIDFHLISKPINPHNPTACFVIEPPLQNFSTTSFNKFSVPGTNFLLERENDFMISTDTGLAFPILKKIPILKKDSAILATSLF